MKNWIQRLVFLCVLLPVAACQAQEEKYQAGVHYQVLPQAVRTANPDKIEINEVFSYHCGHCFNFESALHPWTAKLPEDVDFQRTPAVWMPAMEPLAKAYYAAVLLNAVDKVHVPIFEAFHIKHELQLTRTGGPSEADFAKVFAAQGYPVETFSAAYNSFGLTSMVNQAQARVRGYQTRGTPEIIVNGKYRVALEQAKNFEGMLSVADFLIEKERVAKAAQ